MTVAVVAPAVPERVTSPVANPVTVSLKTTSKTMGDVPVGSAWELPCSIVTVAPAWSLRVAVLFDWVVEATLPAAS